MKVSEVLETCLYVDDLKRAEEFYATILGLRVIAKVEGRHVFFRCGDRVFLIFNPKTTLETGALFPPHGAQGPGHAAFGVRLAEIPAWQAHLKEHGVSIERDFLWPAGGRSIYFRDPAGNSLELASPRIWSIDESRFFSDSGLFTV